MSVLRHSNLELEVGFFSRVKYCNLILRLFATSFRMVTVCFERAPLNCSLEGRIATEREEFCNRFRAVTVVVVAAAAADDSV